MIRGHH